jgi:hypothetical protein
MARPTFDRELAAKVLALAAKAGDEEAAKHFGISTRSIKRYRARLVEGDSQLAEAVNQKTAQLDQHARHWAEDAASFMSLAIRKLGQLVGQAGPKQMRDVTGAIKIVGELDITRKVLGDEQPGAGAEGPAAQANAGVRKVAEAETDPEDDRVH